MWILWNLLSSPRVQQEIQWSMMWQKQTPKRGELGVYNDPAPSGESKTCLNGATVHTSVSAHWQLHCHGAEHFIIRTKMYHIEVVAWQYLDTRTIFTLNLKKKIQIRMLTYLFIISSDTRWTMKWMHTINNNINKRYSFHIWLYYFGYYTGWV